MLFVLQLLQLAAKRLMMRLAIQQLGKHDPPPTPVAAACGDLGGEERSHADWVNPNTAEASLSQRQAFDLFRGTIWLPWQSRRSRRGSRSSSANFSTPFFLFPTFHQAQNAEPASAELRPNVLRALKLFNTLTLLLSPS